MPVATERRFKGTMSEDYHLLRLAMPHFEELQQRIGEAVARFAGAGPSGRIHILDLGCGSGITSEMILASGKDILLTSLDNEEKMTRQATENLSEDIREDRCRVVLQDALDYSRDQRDGTFDIVASVLTLHNMHHAYRSLLHREIFRVLKPGGLFINGDKYVEGDEERFKKLQVALGRFFDAFVPLGKVHLLKDWVLHNVADQAPDRVMKASDAVQELREIGFKSVEIQGRYNMEAVLVAKKPDVEGGRVEGYADERAE